MIKFVEQKICIFFFEKNNLLLTCIYQCFLLPVHHTHTCIYLIDHINFTVIIRLINTTNTTTKNLFDTLHIIFKLPNPVDYLPNWKKKKNPHIVYFAKFCQLCKLLFFCILISLYFVQNLIPHGSKCFCTKMNCSNKIKQIF